MLNIVPTLNAQNDLDQILTYLDGHSPAAADRFASKFDRAVRIIAGQPKLGRVRDDVRPGLRSRAVGDYVLFFVADPTTLTLVRLLHGSRDIDRIMRDDD